MGQASHETTKTPSGHDSLVGDIANIETDRAKIRDAATQYYKDLFEDKSEDNTKHDDALRTLTTQPWNL